MFELKRPVATLRKLWGFLGKVPFGRTVLNHLFGFFVPYSGTVSPEIVELQPGLVKVQMRDQRRVRNHLQSVHATAMCTLMEAATGLAVMVALPDNSRAILTGFQISYLKKGRGTLTAVCRFVVPADFVEGDLVVDGIIENGAGETVATAAASWRVGAGR